MPVILDLPAVRRFTDDLNDRLRRCDNGEGMVGRNLDHSIHYYVQLCRELRAYVNDWARSVSTGQVAFDPDVERLLQEETRHLLHRAKLVAACGRGMNGQWFVLQGLPALHYYVADLDYLLENWVSPCLAVGPAPRVTIPDAAAQQIRERLDTLPALPKDWRSTDAEPLASVHPQRADKQS